MAPILHFQTVERGLARSVVERRSPQAGIPLHLPVESLGSESRATDTPVVLRGRDNIDGPNGNVAAVTPSLKPSVGALAGIITFLSIVILGAGITRIWAIK